MTHAILGISAYYHDSAAALLVDGQIVAAAHEERFSRKKQDSSFPVHAIRFVLEEAGLELADIEAIAFYDKPFIKFERLLETYHGFAPRGLRSFLTAIPVWIKEKLFMRRILKQQFAQLGSSEPPILFPEHHLSHAASAFFPCPFDDAAILTIDGVGEWSTTTIGHGQGNELSVLKELNFPHSLGLLYSAFTYYCGFKVNSGEYKLMGLAPYGNHNSDQVVRWKEQIYEELVDVREDGSFLLNMRYFDYATGLTMTKDKAWHALFGIPRRSAESELTQDYMDLALAIQEITEEIVLRLAETAKTLTGSKYLVMAGGVALNCVANGKLLRSKLFEDIWIQPAAGDAGGALGAALASWHIWSEQPRQVFSGQDAMSGAYLGPEFDHKQITKVLNRHQAPYQTFDNFEPLCDEVARLLDQGLVVGWFQGRMEFGPRALGNRSILGDPRHPEMQKKLNLKIKYREGFRPFAPSVLEEDIQDYFDLDGTSPYMLLVAAVNSRHQRPRPADYEQWPLYQRLYHLRSDIPAVTHIDNSARIQTVSRQTNEQYWQLLNAFKKLTGCSLVVNTSFNVRGEPIVCTPEDAYRCFMGTEMDYLVLGNCLLKKGEQPEPGESAYWHETFDLD